MIKPLAFALSLFTFYGAAIGSAQIYFPRSPFPRPYPPQSRYDSDPNSSPVELGAYVAVGGGTFAAGEAGLYGQWNRTGLCPGLDLRIQGNVSELHGALVGPRLAYKPSGSLHAFHPYVEALFGPNEYPRSSNLLTAYPASYRGVTSAAVFGLDGDLTPHLRFRLIEFSKEVFSGRSDTNPYTITTGIVLHMP